MTRKIYAYVGDIYQSKKLGLSLLGEYRVSPPSVRMRFKRLDPEDVPDGFELYKPSPLESPGEAFPNIKTSHEADRIVLPDITAPGTYPVVTERFKKVVEQVDPGVHDFVPCLAYGPDGRPISDQPLYHFWIERIVVFRGDEPTKAPDSTLRLTAAYRFLNASEAAFSYLADLPIWCDRMNCTPIFFSEEVMTAFKAAGLTGLTPFLDKNDLPDPDLAPLQSKTVGAFWI